MVEKHRRTIRFKKYDYSNSGYYFVTICTQDRKCLFGNVVDNKMVLNDVGNMIKKLWLKIPERFKMVEMDIFQIMPNHLHGIISIVGATLVVAQSLSRADIKPRAGIKPAPTTVATTTIVPTTIVPTVGDIVGGFKSLTTHEYIMNVKNNNWPSFEKRLWQRNFYEHVIRNEYELNKIRQYIKNNPLNWNEDRNNLRL